jgi:hypothetical protein
MLRDVVLLVLTTLSGSGQLGGLSLGAREVRQSFQTLHFTGSKNVARFFDEATPLRLWRVHELLQELERERQAQFDVRGGERHLVLWLLVDGTVLGTIAGVLARSPLGANRDFVEVSGPGARGALRGRP